MSSRTANLLEIEDLRTVFQFERRRLVAVNDVSLHVSPKEIVGIVGESGSGKSMTAMSLLGIVPHPGVVESGRLLFQGRDLLSMAQPEMRKLRGSAISLVYQDPLSSLNPSFNVIWHFREILRAHGVRKSQQELVELVVESLRLVRIPSPEERLTSFPHQLSGGMRQRIVIALALILHPSLIIADEPTTALDVTTQKEIFNLIERLKQELSLSFIVISHNLNLIGERCDRIYVMYAGQVVESGPSEELFHLPLHPYTRGLLDSIPALDARVEKLHTIPGEVQDLMDLPRGCFFAARCELAEAACRETPQELRSFGSGRSVRCWKSDVAATGSDS